MLSTATKTTEATYEYDDEGNVTKTKVVETEDVALPAITTSASTECGPEDDEDMGCSCAPYALEVFLLSVAGAFLGNIIYRAIYRR